MDVVQLKSESIQTLRAKRILIMKSMIENQEGSLLVLGTAYAGADRRLHTISYATFVIFFELWERFKMESWSYTFNQEGLIFYIKLKEAAADVKDILIHYEDYHPLGFAINSEVFSKSGEVDREHLGLRTRNDVYTGRPLRHLLNMEYVDADYSAQFIKDIEAFMVRGDRQTILSNLLVYSYVGAYTKEYGFGMYGPNFSGSNEPMNFEKFIHLIRTFKQEIKHIFNVDATNYHDIRHYQKEVDATIRYVVLNQQSYQYHIFMTTMVMFAFMSSRDYGDMSQHIKQYTDDVKRDHSLREEGQRYDDVQSGFREVFAYYVPFYQKHQSVTATFLYIMSRHHDESVLAHSGQQSLAKIQFLAKNLLAKPNKWEQFDRFCVSNSIYPRDATTLLVLTLMLDMMQRYYLKIKMLFEPTHY